jgi:tRNA1(Val) A37 N6-methylase TrmN6
MPLRFKAHYQRYDVATANPPYTDSDLVVKEIYRN